MRLLYPTAVFVLLIMLPTRVAAQSAALYPVPLEDRIEGSELIVEGRVVDQQSFWNQDRTLIFTASTLDVYRIFKGRLSGSSVSIVTPGGRIGDKAQRVDPALELSPGDVGVFFAKQATLDGRTPKAGWFQPVASVQGMARYDEVRGFATDVFGTYSNIESDLHGAISDRTGEPIVLKDYPVPATGNSRISGSAVVPSISSITPTTTTAGTNSVLTINGSGFEAYDGGTSSFVFFPNADDGGASAQNAPASHVSSWTDTQIQVRVPSRAGTGPVTVRTAAGLQATSAATLSIDYNLLTLSFGGDSWRTSLANKVSGGYSMRLSTSTADGGVDFAASDAVAPFERALLSWQQATGLNVRADGADIDSNRVAPNSENDIATFENDVNPLPAGVLGRAFSGFTSCDGQTWIVEGIDIQFRRDGNGITWNYGPQANSGNMADFESVALHELGHGHQLGHVIDQGAVMHYALTNGTDSRVLDPPTDVAGGNDAIDFAQALSTFCGGRMWTGMVRLVNVGVEDEVVSRAFGLSKAYPNPTSGSTSFSVRLGEVETVAIDVTDVLGRRVARLYEGVLTPGVEHQFRLDGEGLTPGVYMYSVSGESARSVGTFVLMK